MGRCCGKLHPLSRRRREGVLGSAASTVRIALLLAVFFWLGCCGRRVAGQTEALDIEQMAQKDLYAVLELQPGAGPVDVKAAYRKLARKWHPDKNPHDTKAAQNMFAEIAEAYEVLSDDATRRLYDHARRVRAAHELDNHGSGGRNSASTGSGLRGSGSSSGSTASSYDDDFGHHHHHHHHHHNDIHHDPQQDYYNDDFFGSDWGGTGSDWYFGGGLMDGLFGSSFGGDGWGEGEAGFAAGGGVPFGGTEAEGKERGAEGGGGGGGGEAFEFHLRDPMELFEALFGGGSGGGGFDAPEAGYDYRQDQIHDHHHQQQQQQQQQQKQQQAFDEDGVPWVGQDFEQYHDYEDEGRMYRRVITTVVYSDGSSLSTAQDYVFDIASDRWFESSSPYDYHGPGVAPGGAAGGRSSYCGDDDGEAVDNVLRMNEFLRVGHSIASVDRKFKAVLEADCNLVVYHGRGSGRGEANVKVWETASFDSEGKCFAAIQDNGMLVVMAGTDPSIPGNVLWSNNQGHVGWFRQDSFHAAVLPNGNLVISQGDSPMHPAARSCVWGAFGCPGEGGAMEWKLVWISFRSKAGAIWCKAIGCNDNSDHSSSNSRSNTSDENKRYAKDANDTASRGGSPSTKQRPNYDTPGDADRFGGVGGFNPNRNKSGGLLAASATALKNAANRGLAKAKGALEKLKTVAEDTAHAASRPRHW